MRLLKQLQVRFLYFYFYTSQPSFVFQVGFVHDHFSKLLNCVPGLLALFYNWLLYKQWKLLIYVTDSGQTYFWVWCEYFVYFGNINPRFLTILSQRSRNAWILSYGTNTVIELVFVLCEVIWINRLLDFLKVVLSFAFLGIF